MSRRALLVVIAVTVVAIGVGVWLAVFAGRSPQDLQDATRAWADSGPLVYRTTVSIEFPFGMPQETAAFVHSGSLSLKDETASGEVDLSSIANGAGLFGDASQIDVAFDPDGAYVDVLNEDKNWLRIDVEDAGASTWSDLAQLREITLTNPVAILQLVLGSSLEGVEGTETQLEGDPATEYSLVVDLSSSAQASSRAFLDLLDEQFGVSELRLRIWLGADGMPKRIAYAHDLPEAIGSDDVGRLRVQLDLSDEPAAANPTLPSDSEVTNFTDLGG